MWIGYEGSLIGESLERLGSKADAYVVFVQSLPYRFYPIFLLVLGFAVAWMGRDIGAMRRAESRARSGGGVLAPGAEPLMETDDVRAASDLTLEISDTAMDLLGNTGFDPVYGARPLKRAIQQNLENPLAQKILSGDFAPGETIRVDAKDGRFVFQN